MNCTFWTLLIMTKYYEADEAYREVTHTNTAYNTRIKTPFT